MKFAMPSDDGAIKLAALALTDRPWEDQLALFGEKKDVCSPWAGTIAAGALVGDTTRGMACLMLKCHTVCARPTILIPNIVKRLDVCSTCA